MGRIASMTGFGSGSVEAQGLKVRAVLRSVNGRFLDLSVRCPSALMDLEPRVREAIQARLSRGKVTGTIDYEETAAGAGLPQLNAEVARQYLRELQRLAEMAGTELSGAAPVGGALALEVVAGLPGVFRADSPAPEATALEPLVLAAVTQALDELEQMRRSEGETLAADLGARLAALRLLTDRIDERSRGSRDEVRRRLREKVEGLLRPGELNEDRLATEVVLIVERSDITEEVVRFRSHCDQFAEALDRGGDVGRRLNFLLQEMHREINTMSSKSTDSDIIHCTISAKEEVERLREQVQNLA